MKQLIQSDIGTYTFNASAKTVTLAGVTLALEQILLITDVTANVTIYQFNNPALGGSLDVTGTILTLDYNTAALSNTDLLQIYVDIPGAVVTTSGTVTGTVDVAPVATSATQTWNNTFSVNSTLDVFPQQSVAGSVSVALTVTGTITGGVISFVADDINDDTGFTTTIPITVRRIDQPFTNITSVNLTTLTPGTEYVYLADVGGWGNLTCQLTTAIVGSGHVLIVMEIGATTSSLAAVGQTDPTQLHATVVNAGTFATQDSNLAGTISANKVAVTDAAAEASLATLAGAVSGGLDQSNNVQWGGTAVSAANTGAAGTETAPVVRPVARKSCSILTTTPLAANGVYTSSWFDTSVTGDTFVFARALSNVASAGSGFVIQISDDTSNSGLTQSFATTSVSANAVATVNTAIPTRYWRVVYTNGATLQTTFELTVVSGSMGTALLGQGTNINSGVPFDIVQVAAMQINVVGDGSTPNGFINGSGLVAAAQTVSGYLTGSPSNGSNYSAARTPAVFQGGQVASGVGVIWYPSTAKKARLMKYKLEIAADATLSTAGSVLLGLDYLTSTGSAFTIAPANVITNSHRVYVPSSAVTGTGQLWASEWIDLTNGIISAGANTPLVLGITVPQSTSATTPTFTSPSSVQWESATMGFKTVGGFGGARRRQVNNASAATGSVNYASQAFLQGSLVVVVTQTKNIAAGAPTITITDSGSLFTWVNLTKVTNASDGANGSSLQITYGFCNAAGSTTITAAGSVNNPTNITTTCIEYTNCTAIGTGAQVTATGSSTAPSSGAYTPGEVGDLIVTCFASNATTASQSTVSSGYTMRAGIFSTPTTLMVADNWGNGSLSAGCVNVIAVGTEE
jgi:hypothetical protein